MSIRDNKRKQNRNNETNVELANLQAMVEHTAVTNNHSSITKETTTMNINNEAVSAAPVNAAVVVSESDVNPELNEANQTNPAPETVDAAAETESNVAIITTWFNTLAPLTPESALKGLNLQTITGHNLVQSLNLPPIIPTNVADAILAECTNHPSLTKVMPYLSILVGTSRNEQGVDVIVLAGTALTFAKPYIEKAITKWDTFINVINSFIKGEVIVNTPPEVKVEVSPVSAPVESIADRCKRIQQEADAKRMATAANVTSIFEDKSAQQVFEDWRVANPTAGFDEYFSKRNEIFSNYSKWEQARLVS